MKKSRHLKSRMASIRTLKELRDEKSRLRSELIDTEDDIRENYRDLIDALTFRNIINTIAEEIISTNLVVSQVYSMIKPLFKRKKKNKRVEEPDIKVVEPELKGKETGLTDEG